MEEGHDTHSRDRQKLEKPSHLRMNSLPQKSARALTEAANFKRLHKPCILALAIRVLIIRKIFLYSWTMHRQERLERYELLYNFLT